VIRPLELLAAMCVACAGTPERPPAVAGSRGGAVDAALREHVTRATEPARGRSLVARRPERRVIAEPQQRPPRPVRSRRVDVSFHRADLENALRLLAEAGRLNLVVESGLTGSVTASLRDVDAYDALRAIAEANGAAVRYEAGIVSVMRRDAARP
jgi:hypothetical protein